MIEKVVLCDRIGRGTPPVRLVPDIGGQDNHEIEGQNSGASPAEKAPDVRGGLRFSHIEPRHQKSRETEKKHDAELARAQTEEPAEHVGLIAEMRD